MKPKKDKSTRPSIYGLHAVREAWLNDARTIDSLYITAQAERSFEKTLLKSKSLGLRRPKPTIIDKHKLDKMLPKGAVHQGIALSCSDLEEMDDRDLAINLHLKNKSIVVMLDQVTDPHNIGAIIRSAAAFGLDGIILQKKHAPELGGVLAKTACGALDHVRIAKATNLSRAIEEFQAIGFLVVGLDERGEQTIGNMAKAPRNPQNKKAMNKPLDIASPPVGEHDKIMLVLGSEGAGLRHLIKEKCDALVKLPTQGAIASLNVSNAAAVAFYVVSKSR